MEKWEKGSWKIGNFLGKIGKVILEKLESCIRKVKKLP